MTLDLELLGSRCNLKFIEIIGRLAKKEDGENMKEHNRLECSAEREYQEEFFKLLRHQNLSYIDDMETKKKRRDLHMKSDIYREIFQRLKEKGYFNDTHT